MGGIFVDRDCMWNLRVKKKLNFSINLTAHLVPAEMFASGRQHLIRSQLFDIYLHFLLAIITL